MLQAGPVRVTHVITGLEVGGAERLLAHLLAASDPARVRSDVVVLGRDGPVGEQVRALGVPVLVLDLHRAVQLPRAIARLLRHLREDPPDVVHTWMVHGNALGGVAARLAGHPVLWSLHHSDLAAGGVRRSTALLERANAVLSRVLADEVVTTSAAAADLHRRRGYRRDRLVVIPNAAVADTTVRHGESGGLRSELGLPPSCLLVGRIGRLAPQKDWPSFFAGMGSALAGREDVHVVAVGRGVDADDASVVDLVSRAGLEGRCSLLGERADAATLSAQLDVAVSSSAFGETTPLVLLEALGAGTPVVTTDVGDCARLVGPGGLVVPPRDPTALGAAVSRLLDDSGERERRGREGRRHVERRGGTARLVDDYGAAYRRLAAARR